MRGFLLLAVGSCAGSSDPATKCRGLLSMADRHRGRGVDERAWKMLDCDKLMMADRGDAQVLVEGDVAAPAPTHTDVAAPCRRLLEMMDYRADSEALRGRFEALRCGERMAADTGTATVLVE